VTCSLGTVGETNATVTIAVTPTAAGTLPNTITAASPDDHTPGNNTATAQTTVTPPIEGPSADLGVAWNQPGPILPGQTIAYALTVTNAGPDVAEGVHVAVTLPAQPASLPAGCTVTEGGVDCAIAVLGSGEMATFPFSVTPSSGTHFATATATVASALPDPDADNDAASVTVTILVTSPLPPTYGGEGGCCDNGAASVGGKLPGSLLSAALVALFLRRRRRPAP